MLSIFKFNNWRQVVAAIIFIIVIAMPAHAQFNSGSTEADGAFSPTTSQSIPVPASGVFNFTTFNIPAGVTITFTPNSTNTPLTILASGNVTISGTLNIAGQNGGQNGIGGRGGPGGFNGGNGGFALDVALVGGANGNGPGGARGGQIVGTLSSNGAGGGYGTPGVDAISPIGGNFIVGTGGAKYGTSLLQPLIGGSGGGGAGAQMLGARGGGGGGGGGALLIASSGSITIASSAVIDARGGNGATSPVGGRTGGGGAGGGVRVVANTISGTGNFNIAGGQDGATGFGIGGFGYVRAEAFNLTAFNPVIVNSLSGISPSLGTPNPLTLPNLPSLKIASVAGINTPTLPSGSFSGPADVVLPSTQTTATVVVEGTNLPSNLMAVLTVVPEVGQNSVTNTGAFTATGTPGLSTANGNIAVPSGLSLLYASANIDLTQAKLAPIFIDGEAVERIEITAVYGGESQTYFITRSGRRVSAMAK